MDFNNNLTLFSIGKSTENIFISETRKILNFSKKIRTIVILFWKKNYEENFCDKMISKNKKKNYYELLNYETLDNIFKLTNMICYGETL